MLNAGYLVALVTKLEKFRDEKMSRLFLTMILLCSFSATMQFVLQHYDVGSAGTGTPGAHRSCPKTVPGENRTRAAVPITFIMCSIPKPQTVTLVTPMKPFRH